MQNIPAFLIVVGSLLGVIGSWWYQEQNDKRKRELVVFLGAAITIGGVFWSSSQQTVYEQKLSKLNETMFSNITGGNSYCYVKAAPADVDPQRYWALTLWQVGEQPCYDVMLQTKDVDAFQQVKGKQMAPGKLLATTMEMKAIGTVPPKYLGLIFRILDLDGLTERKFSFIVSSRNGYVSQKLALRKVNGEWKRASEGKVNLMNFPIQDLDQTEEGFPRRSDGQIEW